MGLTKYGCIILLFGFGLQLLKYYVNGGVCQSKTRMDGKVVIVTGANTGLGKTTSEELAKRGATVVMACRNVPKGDEAKLDILDRNLDIQLDQLHVMKLDLASMASIRTFVKTFKLNYKKLDVLINNAAVMEPPYSKTEDGFELTIGVNYLGHFLLTNLLLDYLVSSSPTRVINLSSTIMDTERFDFDKLAVAVSREDYSGPKAYAQSKLAIVLFTKELGRRLRGTSITTYSMHPGIIITDIVRWWPLQQTWFGRRLLYWATWWFTKDVTAGVQTVLCCTVDEALSQETGQYYSDCAHSTPPDSAMNDEDAKKLWRRSMELVKMDPTNIHALAK